MIESLVYSQILIINQTFLSFPSCCASSMSSLTSLAPLEAVLFDVDGTLCDSDPLHYYALREMLQEVLFLFLDEEKF